jgi:hypothetical protein
MMMMVLVVVICYSHLAVWKVRRRRRMNEGESRLPQLLFNEPQLLLLGHAFQVC